MSAVWICRCSRRRRLSKDGTATLIKQAVRHKGFALVDVFQPCVSFKKVNTLQWFNE